MARANSSSPFTNPAVAAEPFGPPLIGALLRMPWEAIQQRMLERLHQQGFADFDAAYLTVFQYPGPQDQRPSELAARLRISKQALNHLLGQLEQRGYLKRQSDPDDGRSKRIMVTSRGATAITTIREAVAEIEDSWAQQLGPKRFNQLLHLLRDLNQTNYQRSGSATSVRAVFAQLGPQSRGLRFGVARPALTAEELERLARVDGRREVLVAYAGADPVGIAHLVRDDQGAGAEIAWAVADAWQRLGIGMAFAKLLSADAAAAGIRELRATMHVENRASFSLMRRATRIVSRRIEGGELHVVGLTG